MASIRDRIIEFRRVPAAELQPHPRNWRKHPATQRRALTGVLQEIGYADALVARRREDGRLELIDGHLRAETTPTMEVPVLIVDLDDREAALLLAVHDPLSAMAETDEALLQSILAMVSAEQIDLSLILGDVLSETDQALARSDSHDSPEPRWDDVYQVVVECGNEAKQREVYEKLSAEGLRCRVLTL